MEQMKCKQTLNFFILKGIYGNAIIKMQLVEFSFYE